MMNRHLLKWIGVGMLLLILIGVVIDLTLTIRLSAEVKAKIMEIQRDKSLPCAAIPTRYILQEPECADKLLQAMNVTRVRILPRGSLVPQMDEEMWAMPGNMTHGLSSESN